MASREFRRAAIMGRQDRNEFLRVADRYARKDPSEHLFHKKIFNGAGGKYSRLPDAAFEVRWYLNTRINVDSLSLEARHVLRCVKDGTMSVNDALILMCSTSVVDLNCVKLLCKYGAHVRHTDERGWTALHYAAISGNMELAEIMLDNGCPVNQTDAAGYTCLHLAVLHAHESMAKLLYACDGNLSIKTRCGHDVVSLGLALRLEPMIIELQKVVRIATDVRRRGQRWFQNIMGGIPSHCDEELRKQSEEYRAGRMIVCVFHYRPYLFAPVAADRQLVPRDLMDEHRLGIKAFGRTKWRLQLEKFDFLSPEVLMHVKWGCWRPRQGSHRLLTVMLQCFILQDANSQAVWVKIICRSRRGCTGEGFVPSFEVTSGRGGSGAI
jgi:hypothetical protein